MQGVFSFGYFSLDKQRKVSRSSVREPTLKLASRSVSVIIGFSLNRTRDLELGTSILL